MICYSPWSRNRKVPIEKPGGGIYNQCMWLKYFIAVFSILFLFSSCVPRSGDERDSIIRISWEQEVAWGEEAYREILKKEKISQDRQLIDIVERVGRQLAAVSSMPNLQWEFTLIDSNKKNVFVLPGGKVVISTGILPACANEAGLAVVMSHGIAHVLARHGARRMPQSHIAPIPVASSLRLANHESGKNIMAALGVGDPVGITRPFSRDHEAEADATGTGLMAKAGYDPGEAERFWDRFNKMQQGAHPPEILATHPIDATRIQEIRQLLPQANRVYQANPLKHGLGESFLYILSRRQMKQNFNSASPPPNPKTPTPQAEPQ